MARGRKKFSNKNGSNSANSDDGFADSNDQLNLDSRYTSGGQASKEASRSALADPLVNPSSLIDTQFAYNQIGVTNLTRSFLFDTEDTAPQVIHKRSFPMAGFFRGFTASDISAQDDGAATDTTKAPDDELYPVTISAINFEDEVYPILANLLSSGLGSRHVPSFSATVRYFSMTIKAMIMMKQIMALNSLTYHTDWNKVFPFTSEVPKTMYDIAAAYDATDVGVADRWAPYIRRLNSLIMFPEITKAINELTSPYLQGMVGGRVISPLWTTGTVDAMEEDLDDTLKYVEIELRQTNATLKSFLPFSLSEQRWTLTDLIERNVDLESASYNSGYAGYATFGDTGDPVRSKCMMFDINSDTMIFHSASNMPLFKEIMNAKWYEMIVDAVDDEYVLMSMHNTSVATIRDDAGELWNYSSTQTTRAELYCDILNDRYFFDNDRGILNAGTMATSVHYDTAHRLVKLYTNFLFSRRALVDVARMAAGSSLKQVRETLYAAAHS